MANITSYSEVTELNIPKEVWDEAWFTLMTLKAFLAPIPGFVHFHISARPLNGGDVHLLTRTVWEHPEVLQEWLQGIYTVDKVLGTLEKPAYGATTQTYEDFG